METLAHLKLEAMTSVNEKMSRCLKLASLAAQSDVPLLILGETGTGKTLLAHAIHNSSSRAGGPFISFNASAMSDTLLESQLFGHERGAFTGAHRAVKGKFEQAHKGTLFFDEIADMSQPAQAKILRAIEYGEFERLGSERMLQADVRIISATNHSLRERISRRKFREDLYQRLKGITLVIPSLRERQEELPTLVTAELKQAARRAGKKISGIHPAAMDRLLTHQWPGNLRELNHVMLTVVLFCDGKTVLPEHVIFEADPIEAVPASSPARTTVPVAEVNGKAVADDFTLGTVTRRHILAVYEQANRNQRRAARLLGISRAKLRRHLEDAASK